MPESNPSSVLGSGRPPTRGSGAEEGGPAWAAGPLGCRSCNPVQACVSDGVCTVLYASMPGHLGKMYKRASWAEYCGNQFWMEQPAGTDPTDSQPEAVINDG